MASHNTFVFRKVAKNIPASRALGRALRRGGMALLLVALLAPAGVGGVTRAAGNVHSLLATAVRPAQVPAQACPTDPQSNGTITQATGQPAEYVPTTLYGNASTTTSPVASVCVANTTAVTQTMTGPSCANFPVAAGTAIMLSGPAGTYECGLKGSTSVLTVILGSGPPPTTIQLYPASSTDRIGSSHTVTATVDLTGRPTAGIAVTFTVTSGPDAGLTGKGITDAQGQTSFSYVGNKAGVDRIIAQFVDKSGITYTSNTATEDWVTATISANPSRATVHQAVTIVGSYFDSNEAVKLYWGSTATPPLTSTTAASNGSFRVTITVPRVAAGTHVVIAVGQTSGLTARAAVQVVPQITVQPIFGQAGDTAHVSGDGFGALQTITVTWSSPSGLLLGTTTTDATGSFSGTTRVIFTVPSSAAGRYQIYATDHTGNLANTSFIVSAQQITLTPNSGPAGTTVVISGTGYTGGATVQFTYCNEVGCPNGQVVGSTTADTSGAFSGVSIQVPVTATVGQGVITARSLSSRGLTWAPFTVTGA